MSRSRIRALSIAAAVAIVGSFAAHAGALAPQTSQSAGVAVEVTPMDVAATAREWTFAVALDTHRGNLADDLAAQAFIVDAAGKARPALGWDGDPPGGHHRKGVLRFAAPSPKPAQIEVRIQRASESAPRTFRWAD